MDWNAVFTSLGGAAVMMAVGGFLLKKWVGRMVDLRFDRQREMDAAEVREQFRQRAALHDEQVAQLQAVLELVGRIRDTALGAHEAAESGWSLDLNRSLWSIGEMYRPLCDLVHKGRAVLPLEAFAVVHELQGPVRALRRMALPDDEVPPEHASFDESYRSQILAAAEQIDFGFKYLTSVARAVRGTEPIGGRAELQKGGQRAVLPELGKDGVHRPMR